MSLKPFKIIISNG
jgi:hypothetical protein